MKGPVACTAVVVVAWVVVLVVARVVAGAAVVVVAWVVVEEVDEVEVPQAVSRTAKTTIRVMDFISRRSVGKPGAYQACGSASFTPSPFSGHVGNCDQRTTEGGSGSRLTTLDR